jgi:ligand-binding sensor domain-containing protein
MYLCPAFEGKHYGLVVQSVRMPPCHGGGRGFESRPVRKKRSRFQVGMLAFFVFPTYSKFRPDVPNPNHICDYCAIFVQHRQKMPYRSFLFYILLACLSACQSKDEPAKSLQPLGQGLESARLKPWGNVPYRLAFQSFTTSDGLCSNTINCLYQDKSGLLWIGTDDGVNRYDGYSFMSFRHNDATSNSLADNVIGSIAEDSKGNIWVLSATGLTKISESGNRIKSYADTAFSRSFNSFHSYMCIDAADRIWITGTAPVAFDIPSRRFLHPEFSTLNEHIRFNNASRFTYDKSPTGRVTALIAWITKGATPETDSTHVRVLDVGLGGPTEPIRQIWQAEMKEPDYIGQMNHIRVDGENRLWIGRQDGALNRLDLKTGRMQLFKPLSGHPTDNRRKLGGTTLNMFYAPQSNVMWLAGYGGIQRIEASSDTIPVTIRYRKEKIWPWSLPSDVATSVLEDQNGNLWVGNSDGGLSLYTPYKHKFELFQQFGPDSTRLPDNNILSVCFDHQDRLWVGTENGLSMLKDRTKKQFVSYQQQHLPPVSGNHNMIRAIQTDASGKKLYLAYWGSILNQFDLQTATFEDMPIRNFSKKVMVEKLGCLYIRQIIKDSIGNLYYANWGGSMDFYDTKNQTFTHYCDIKQAGETAGWLSSLSLCVFPEDQKHIWLGNQDGKAVQCLDLTQGKESGAFSPDFPVTNQYCRPNIIGKFTNYFPNPKDSTALKSALLSCIYKDKKGQLWFGTQQGLHKILDRTKGIFKHYGQDAGFSNEVINCMQEDRHGRLWIGTNGGLFCFDPSIGRVIARYTAADGLQGEQFNAFCCAQNSYGLMAFGGANGFNIFHPDSLIRNESPPAVNLLQVTANNVVKQVKNGTLELPYDSSTVTIRMASMDFSEPKRNLFQYRIEGYEKTFSEPSANNEARYINLPHGKHHFLAKSSNSDGVWSGKGAELTIIIKPPFWLRWWFIFCCLGVAGYGIFRYFQWRIEVHRRRNLIDYLKVQSLQAQLNPHFLFNVLATMQSRILNNDPQQASKMVVDLAKLMRNFLEATIAMDADKKDIHDGPIRSGITSQEITLAQEIELLDMYVKFEQMKHEGRFQYNIKYDRTEIVPGNETLPPLLIQPYVENAIKHGLLYLREGEGKLLLHFYKDDGYLICRIEDNGIGMAMSKKIQEKAILLHKSRGKDLVERRVRVLNQGKYDIRISEPANRADGGTIVEIKIGYK